MTGNTLSGLGRGSSPCVPDSWGLLVGDSGTSRRPSAQLGTEQTEFCNPPRQRLQGVAVSLGFSYGEALYGHSDMAGLGPVLGCGRAPSPGNKPRLLPKPRGS